MDKDDYKEISTLLQEIQTQVKAHSREFIGFLSQDVNRDSVGWPLLILSKLNQIHSKLDAIQEAVGDGIDAVIETLSLVQERLNRLDTTRSPKQAEVEDRFGKPVQELLKERKGKSLREIAQELEVSRGTVSNWLKSGCG